MKYILSIITQTFICVFDILAPAVPSIEVILEEERQFNIQYTDWKKQYNDWKEQNKSKHLSLLICYIYIYLLLLLIINILDLRY